MMKPTIIILLALTWALPFAAVAADNPKITDKPTGVVVQKVESDSTLKRMFDEVWAKLRGYGPKLSTSDARTSVTAVAGVRGAESTNSQIKPYWKGDRTDDPAYVQEVNAYNAAQTLADNGAADKAAAAFEEFLKTYPKSVFKPSAQFALGLAYGAAGQAAKGKAALDGFVRDYPTH